MARYQCQNYVCLMFRIYTGIKMSVVTLMRWHVELKRDITEYVLTLRRLSWNRPFAGSSHMVRNKLHWDANDAVRLSKQRKVGLDW